MKKLILLLLLAASTTAARAQATPAQVVAVKSLLTSKTWKTESTKINGLSPEDFERMNNIHKVDTYPAGDRYKFNSDGTFVIISTAGGAKTGIWDVNASGQLVLNPGQNGGTIFGLTTSPLSSGFSGRTLQRLGMCSVTSLYDVAWVPAQ